MKVGVDYYPEQCDEACWPIDVRLMAEAGISVVRMAEFAWSRLEPAEGSFAFDWLDRVLDMLHGAGIEVVLGTPTATPPAWLHARFPDIYPADKRKYRLGFGTREQRCLNNDDMRAHSRRIVEVLARRYAGHPAVVGWQTDNELTANLCYCPTCQAKFHAWLRARYKTLEALNHAWGTAFWSQEYSDWSQIPLPWVVKCGDAHNPSLQLEFRRFQSEATVAFQREQVSILRANAPGHFVTHNLMGLHNAMDYYALAEDLDFVSWDNYPDNPWGREPFGMPLAADVMRGIKGRNVWVMEQQNGITGWDKMGRRPSGAWLRCAAWQAVAHGADAVVFFRWRSAAHGTEQYWHGVINHDGMPRRRYREVAEFAREMRDLSPDLDGTEARADVAILNGYDQHFAFDIQPQADGLRLWDQAGRYYGALHRAGINVDVVPVTADLARYKVVIAPGWYVLTSSDADRFRAYVRQGGTLVLGARTGVKDERNACREEPLPALLRDVVGLEVDDYDPLGKDETRVRGVGDREYTASVWADALVLRGAQAVAHYAGSVYGGEPAVARHAFGEGVAWYFGTFGEPAFYDDLLGRILDEAGVVDRLRLPEGVDAAWRENDESRLLFLINFQDAEATLPAPRGLEPLLGRAPTGATLTLPPHGVAIYRARPAHHGADARRPERRAAPARL